MTASLQSFKADFFRVLAHPVRIRILEVLREAHSLTVNEIHQRVGAEPSNVSQHLAALRGQGLVDARREGTSVWYTVAVPEVFEVLDAARAIFEKQLSEKRQLVEALDTA